MAFDNIQPGEPLRSRDLRELSRAARGASAMASFGGGAATVAGMSAGTGEVATDYDWFTARITGTVTGGYTFVERWIGSTYAEADKPSGRFNGSHDPAVALFGATFATNDIVLVQRAFGAGGQAWQIAPPGPVGAAGGGNWKASCRAATTTSGTLASSFENGDTIDGIALATGDRILIKNQSDQKENGIYVVNASGAPTRATDSDTGGELVYATVLVREGTVNADTIWNCAQGSVTLGTTFITFDEITIADASTTVAGRVTTGAQSFAGAKTFVDSVRAGSYGTSAPGAVTPFKVYLPGLGSSQPEGQALTVLADGGALYGDGVVVAADWFAYYNGIGSAPASVNTWFYSGSQWNQFSAAISIYNSQLSGGATMQMIVASGINIVTANPEWFYITDTANLNSGVVLRGQYSKSSSPDCTYIGWSVNLGEEWTVSKTGFAVGAVSSSATKGITTTKTVKDGTGTNQTVTITGGLITGWT